MREEREERGEGGRETENFPSPINIKWNWRYIVFILLHLQFENKHFTMYSLRESINRWWKIQWLSIFMMLWQSRIDRVAHKQWLFILFLNTFGGRKSEIRAPGCSGSNDAIIPNVDCPSTHCVITLQKNTTTMLRFLLRRHGCHSLRSVLITQSPSEESTS